MSEVSYGETVVVAAGAPSRAARAQLNAKSFAPKLEAPEATTMPFEIGTLCIKEKSRLFEIE